MSKVLSVKIFSSCVFLALMSFALQGCEESTQACPKADQAFFDKSIKGHLERNPGKNGVIGYQIVGEAHYDSRNNWWVVPVDSDDMKMQALISCDGRLEFTGR